MKTKNLKYLQLFESFGSGVYLNFCLDEDGEYMEDTMIYTIDGEDQVNENEIDPVKVKKYAQRLMSHFSDVGLSKWMTEIIVTIVVPDDISAPKGLIKRLSAWGLFDCMNITLRHFTEPDSDSFFDTTIEKLPVDFPDDLFE
jgi:hypothetical protein